MTTTQELICKRYHLNESHATWQPEIDNWYSVEAFRLQAGRLPTEGDSTQQVLMDFLDNKALHSRLLQEHHPLEFGSIYLSAKRALYRALLEERDDRTMLGM